MSTALNNNFTRSRVPGTVAISDAEQLALATGAAAYRWEDLTKAPVSPSMLNPRRYGDGAKVAMLYVDACFSPAETAPAHIQSTKYIAIFTSNSHDDLRRIDLVRFEKPPGFPSVRQKYQIWL